MEIVAVCLLVIFCIGIGGWLVVAGHPWFGLLAMLIGGAVSYKPDK